MKNRMTMWAACVFLFVVAAGMWGYYFWLRAQFAPDLRHFLPWI